MEENNEVELVKEEANSTSNALNVDNNKSNDTTEPIKEVISEIKSIVLKNDKQLEKYIKWNIDYENQVRNSMQKELEEYHNREKDIYICCL